MAKHCSICGERYPGREEMDDWEVFICDDCEGHYSDEDEDELGLWDEIY